MTGSFSAAFSTAYDRVGVTRSECPWPLSVEACCSGVDIDPDDPRVASVVAAVSEMMTAWSGGSVGGCDTIRPLGPCPICRTGSCCGAGDAIVLHDVYDVIQVRIDGEPVDPSLYHYDNKRGILVAVPPMMWPMSDPRWQDTGSLEVDVATGRYPDAWALSVANELACELLKACAGVKCRIPSNATSVTSLGVTVTLSDEELQYVIPSARAWVAATNGAHAVMPARITSPEADRAALGGPVPYRWRPW